MSAINPATVLAKIRSKIDAQQQVISLLEGELQNAILGGGTQTKTEVLGFDIAPATAGNNASLVFNDTTGDIDLVETDSSGNVVNTANGVTPSQDSIGFIYTEALNNEDTVHFMNAIDAGLDEMSHIEGGDELEQDALRQLLYQARALLGELRIEEQAWNGEINSEKTLRKEVNDFAKV
ncbi:MAG: hypothetical protein HRT47_02595 [Candidatus Caenarcaniphilales bacterium]|nr:hypothetical protein [Candidatus Caenarcaniphilales bacterium]